MAAGTPRNSPGPGVDAQGTPVIDPTANVVAMLDAAIKRQDDLRMAESRHVREISELRAACNSELRAAETGRIDANRLVDVGAVQRAAEVVAAQAEALRLQVQATAIATATSLAAALDPIQKDIADLRRAQYEAQGVKANITERREVSGAMVALIGLGIALVLAVLTVVAFVIANNGP